MHSIPSLLQRFLLLLSLSLLLTSCHISRTSISTPKAEQGVLDLRNWDFEKNGSVSLSGTWEFYWEKLLDGTELTSNSTIQPDGMLDFPAPWESYTLPDGRTLSHLGYASFKLKILLPENPEKVAFLLKKLALQIDAQILTVNTAYSLKVFSAEGKQLGEALEAGIVGTTRENSIPLSRFAMQAIPYAPEWTILFQISNFHYFSGGPLRSPNIGLYEDFRHGMENKRSIDFMVIGSLVVMGIYHFFLFALYPKEKSPLYLALIALCMVPFTILINLHLENTFPHVYFWEIYTRVLLETMIFSSVFFLYFIQNTLKDPIPKRVFSLFISCFLVTSVYFLFFPLHWQLSKAVYFSFLSVLTVSLFWVFYVLIQGLKEKNLIAQVILVGFAVFAMTISYDVLVVLRVITKSTTFINTYGLIFFFLSQALVIAIRNQTVQKEHHLVQKQAIENLNKADQLKDEFLANTSHELRTPLHGIIGIVESLMDGVAGKLPQKAEQNLALVAQSGRRLSNLIDDILDFSKMKHHDLQLQLNAVDLRSSVEIILTLSQPLLNQKKLTLRNQIEADFPLAEADESRLQQILYNLIGNAVKFTREGEISIFAKQEGKKLRIFVKDTGSGISEDQKKYIFLSFVQVEASLSREHGGTGLGLAVTQKLVELHGGSMEVESSLGEGSTFSFTLPLASEQNRKQLQTETFIHPEEIQTQYTQKQAQFSTDLEGAEEHKEQTILLVDDEAVNLQILKNHLYLYPYRILTAENGFEALQILKTEKPDLILLDLMMPGISGYEVCRKIRNSDNHASLPILMLTAKSHLQDLVEGFKSGANDYLTKPFSKQELLSRIKTQLTLSEQSRALETHNKNLEGLVQERTADLKIMYEQVVISEKMAALGRLVAGISHEMNTPLGIGVTAASHLSSETDTFLEAYKTNKMTRSSLERYTALASDSAQLILSNIQFAADLLKNFKQIAVDQSSERARVFNVKEYLEQVLHRLKPELRKAQHEIHVIGNDDCELNSYPGALAQVFTNFVVNSVLHGYDKEESGVLEVSVQKIEDLIQLDYKDDGKGIDPEDMDHIFESFFTTKPGTGGSGLGLYIVYNLVTQRLGGSIQCHSKLGAGTTFTILIPNKL